MTIARPHEIKATHLARRAVVYLRQSTPEQVQSNQGSTAAQLGQRRYAEEWGWPADAIEIIDSDLGLSGAAAAHRPGYRRLVEQIKEGAVGVVLVSDYTRLGRNLEEWLAFLTECARHGVLIANDGKIIDAADQGALLSTRMLALVGEYENAARREHIRRGIAAKVAAGKAVTAAPAGYVSVGDGAWELDVPSVQTALNAVFRTFLEERSCARTVRALRKLGVRIPRRPPGKPLRWVEPTVGVVRQILKNERYTGSYHYREQVTDPVRGRNARGQLRVRRARDEERIVVPNHHPPYIDYEQWREIQEILRLHAPSAERRNLGPAAAVLQGVVRCGLHTNQAMSVGYKSARRDGRRAHNYYCVGNYRRGGEQCGHTAGRILDEAVVRVILDRLAPPSLHEIHAAWEQVRRSELGGRHLVQMQLNQARQTAVEIEHHYMHADPVNRLVAHRLESKLEAAMREIERLEGDLHAAKSEPSILTESAFDELTELCADLPQLFWAPTTTHEERKEIVRTFVKTVIVEERSPEVIHARIVWADGAPDSCVEARLFRYAHRMIVELAAEGSCAGEIAERLNELQLMVLRGGPWSEQAVKGFLERRVRGAGRATSRPEPTDRAVAGPVARLVENVPAR
jgi:DNA invertase Pin-like site-specific DNA recombinase